MRIVICDDDPLLRDLLEAVIEGTGHEVAGVAITTADGVRLIESGRPDAVIVDLSLGFNTDFDVIASAIAVGARTIVFTHHPDADLLARYPVPPTVVVKPDLGALERALADLARATEATGDGPEDRRRRPSRAAAGPRPTGVGDVQAFFEAVNEAQPGDSMVSIELEVGAEVTAADLTRLARDTDRVVALPRAVRCFLPAGGEDGVASLLSRAVRAGAVTPAARATAVVVADGESGADAFDRLKHHGEPHELGPHGP